MHSAWQTAAVSLPNLRQLPADQRPSRREVAFAILATIVRLIVCFVLIVLVLSLVPDTPDERFILPFLIAFALVVAYIWFFKRQLGAVYHAKFPTLRAAEALVLAAAMFLAIFSMIYVMQSMSDPEAFTEQLEPFTSYYFSLTVLATVGFGDITPVSTAARSVTMVQMALDLVFVAMLIRIVGGAAKLALQERHEDPKLPTTASVIEE